MERMKNQNPKYNVCKETTLIITRSSHVPSSRLRSPYLQLLLLFVFHL